MSRLRILLVAVAVLVLALGGGAWWFLARLGAVVEKAIEEQGRAITGTAVDATGVRVSLAKGTGRIGRLTIANPEGWSKRDAVMLEDATLTLDLSTVRKPVVIVKELSFARATALYELDSRGKANLDALRTRADRSRPASASASEGPKLVLRRFALASGTVEVDANALGKGTQTVDLKPVIMTNLGAPNGATSDQIGESIVKALTKEIGRAAGMKVFWQSVDEKTGGLGTKLKGLFR